MRHNLPQIEVIVQSVADVRRSAKQATRLDLSERSRHFRQRWTRKVQQLMWKLISRIEPHRGSDDESLGGAIPNPTTSPLGSGSARVFVAVVAGFTDRFNNSDRGS